MPVVRSGKTNSATSVPPARSASASRLHCEDLPLRSRPSSRMNAPRFVAAIVLAGSSCLPGCVARRT